MYKLLAITVVGALALARAADEEVEHLWLNELHYTESTGVPIIEVVSRPKKADAEDNTSGRVSVQWYGGVADAVTTPGIASVQVAPPADDANEDVKKWNGNWFGQITDSSRTSSFGKDATSVGGLRLTSPFDTDFTRSYCWGTAATLNMKLDDDTTCDVLLTGLPGTGIVNRALVDKSSPGTDGGVKEADFQFVSFVTTAEEVMSTPGLPNNCVEGKTCEAKVQTMGEYSFAWSINSFAVVMGASIAALVGIAAP